MKKNRYTVINVDYEELGTFDSYEEARDYIKELKAFDRANQNPFNEHYQIVVECEEVE